MNLAFFSGILFSFGSISSAWYAKQSPSSQFPAWMCNPFISIVATIIALAFSLWAGAIFIELFDVVYGFGMLIVSFLMSAIIIRIAKNRLFPQIFFASIISVLLGIIFMALSTNA